MSRVTKFLWLKGHKCEFQDWMFTACLVDMLIKRGKSAKNVADDLGLAYEKIKNWYYRQTRVSGFDFWLAQTRYSFVNEELVSTYDDLANQFHIKYESAISLPKIKRKEKCCTVG